MAVAFAEAAVTLLRRVGAGAAAAAGLALAPLATAGEEDEDHADEEQDHGCQRRPHTDRVEGVRAAAVLVDVVLDDLWGVHPF